MIIISQLEILKILLDIKDSSGDDLLTILLDQAKQEILNYTRRKTWIDALNTVQVELAVEKYNFRKQGNETSRSEGGISVSYKTEISANIKNTLNNYRAARGVIVNES